MAQMTMPTTLTPPPSLEDFLELPVDENNEPADDVLIPPDWMIEILSPDQKSGLVIRKILFSLEQGGQLAWLIDPADCSVVAFYPDRLPKSLQGSDPLPVLQGIPWSITVDGLFESLKISRR
ncbi:MAG: Uma2 family endonuclease [Thermostichus sp. HHBFW_bins_43]